jgi:protein CpxP
MKKIASILVFVFAFTLTTQAQKKRKDNRPQLSVEQHTELAVKKMTLALDLSKKQQDQIMPLIKSQATAKKEIMVKRKAMKESNSKPSTDEIFAMKSKILDDQIDMKTKMKEILKKEQFEKFEKKAKTRRMRGQNDE